MIRSLADLTRADTATIAELERFGGISAQSLLAAAYAMPDTVIGGTAALATEGENARFTRAGLARCIAQRLPRMRTTTAFAWASGIGRDLALQGAQDANGRADAAASARQHAADAVAKGSRLVADAQGHMAARKAIGFDVGIAEAVAHVKARMGGSPGATDGAEMKPLPKPPTSERTQSVIDEEIVALIGRSNAGDYHRQLANLLDERAKAPKGTSHAAGSRGDMVARAARLIADFATTGRLDRTAAAAIAATIGSGSTAAAVQFALWRFRAGDRGDVIRFDAGTPVQVKARNFKGVAYGGGVVTDHPVWDRVAFDLSTTKVEDRAPVLYMHRDPVGVLKSATVAQAITVLGELFADIDAKAREIADKADRGLPWQLSVGIFPGRVDEIAAGATSVLNGQVVTGPLTVFRDSRIREVSFCPLGADHTTAAEVL